MFAGVALTGICVNDSIVLISFVNSLRRKGTATAEAVVTGSVVRLRPIILTSVTTIAGLFPMAIGLGSRVGSILAGRDANLLLLTGDPLEAETWVDRVIIEGKLVYEREKDYRLKELLTGREVPAEEVGEEEGDSDSEGEE